MQAQPICVDAASIQVCDVDASVDADSSIDSDIATDGGSSIFESDASTDGYASISDVSIHGIFVSPDMIWAVVGCRKHTNDIWDDYSEWELDRYALGWDLTTRKPATDCGSRCFSACDSDLEWGKDWDSLNFMNRRMIDNSTGIDVIDKFVHGREIRRICVSPSRARSAVKVGPEHESRVMILASTDSGDLIGDPIPVVQVKWPRMSFSPNGKRLIITYHIGYMRDAHIDVEVYDVDTAQLIFKLNLDGFDNYGVLLSHDDSNGNFRDRGDSEDDFPTFCVRDVSSGNIVCTGNGNPVAISPNGERIVIHDKENAIIVWDIALLSDQMQSESVISDSTSQRLLIACSDNPLRLSVAGLYSSSFLLKDARLPAAFSPDGSKVVAASSDHMIYLWDANDATIIGHALQGHTKPITAIAFSPSGSRIVSASDDLTLRI